MIPAHNYLTILDIYKMKKKLGIKQNVSVSDLEHFRSIDPLCSEEIKVTPSPIEKFNEKRMRQLRMWIWFGIL